MGLKRDYMHILIAPCKFYRFLLVHNGPNTRKYFAIRDFGLGFRRKKKKRNTHLTFISAFSKRSLPAKLTQIE